MLPSFAARWLVAEGESGNELEIGKNMLDTTAKAIESVCMMDPSIDRARLRDGLRVIAGDIAAVVAADAEDRLVSRAEAARLLGVSLATISTYASHGVIRRVRLGATGARASGYSLKSIRTAMATK